MKTNEKLKKASTRCKEPIPFYSTIWCDDFTDVWIGNCKKLNTEKPIKKQNHPESESFEAVGKCCDYIYFVCWSNDGGFNGFIGDITYGTTKVLTGDNSNWEVFATGIDFDNSSSRPDKVLVESQMKIANCDGWTRPFVGNTNGREKGLPRVPPIGSRARYMWFDSGLDTSTSTTARVPFKGFNHNEFLIFRLPLRDVFGDICHDCPCSKCDCDCNDCDGCNKQADEQNLALRYKALDKQFTEPSVDNKNCGEKPNDHNCDLQIANPNIKDLSPCFYFEWGDGASDSIEEHDTEVVYITVCNPFNDIRYKGLKITKLSITPNQGDQVKIVPDSFICIDCLEPCSCVSREFALITRNCKDLSGEFTLEVDYCFESIELTTTVEKHGKAHFKFTITDD
ncbi:hypothetical protein [uncultured Dokdonia sp.]|uniref:hypothetical protein n=1 Tax=uncultured Dokdonia sp. TaxID=575653 RepID=UPI0026186EAF|nr:hypothetical protein [uncultured Dokdonia sp.]